MTTLMFMVVVNAQRLLGTFSQQNSSLNSDSNVCVTLYIIGGQFTPITVKLIEWSTVNVPGRMHEEWVFTRINFFGSHFPLHIGRIIGIECPNNFYVWNFDRVSSAWWLVNVLGVMKSLFWINAFKWQREQKKRDRSGQVQDSWSGTVSVKETPCLFGHCPFWGGVKMV